jgi:hypothetical protein
MSERAQAVRVRAVPAEFEQVYREDVERNTDKERVINGTHFRDVSETSDSAEHSADSIRTVKSGVCYPVSDKDMVQNSESGASVSLGVEDTLKEHVGTLGCDHRERCQVQQSSGSTVAQGRNETEEELAEQEEEGSLVRLLEQRLQFVLRSLTKLCISKTGGTKKDKE